MAVTGFSNTGFVGGTYTDAGGGNHGFVWNGKTVFDLVPNPLPNQTVSFVGVSDAGDVAVNLYDKTSGANLAYVGYCRGHGC